MFHNSNSHFVATSGESECEVLFSSYATVGSGGEAAKLDARVC